MNIAVSLPEIVFRIGCFLSRGMLASSTRVSRLWNQELTPLLYWAIHCNYPQPAVETLVLKAHHIRSLTFNASGPHQKGQTLSTYSLLPNPCRKLQALAVLSGGGQEDTMLWGVVVLISMNPNLAKLHIGDQTLFPPLVRSCWRDMFVQCSRVSLHTLLLVGVGLDAQGTNQFFLALGPTLVNLNFICCRFAWTEFTTKPQFPSLKSLKMNGVFSSLEQEQVFIQQCPGLKSLEWDSTLATDPSDNATLFRNLKCQRWPHLTSLQLKDSNRSWGDRFLAMMLDSYGLLTTLIAPSSKFWYRSLDALERHFGTLTTLELNVCQSWMTQRILCSCPKLVQFHCAVLFAHEVAKGQWAEKARVHQVQVDLKTDTSMRQYEAEHALENVDPIKLEEHIARLSESRQYTMIHEQNRSWACQDLQEFRIVLQFEHLAGAAWDEQVFQQLAALTKLQLIDICRPVHPSTIAIPERSRGLLLNLHTGLYELEPLKELHTLLFKGTRQQMNEADVQWMLDQWPNLKKISSNLHTDEGVCSRLKQMINNTNRGIEIVED